MNPVNDTSGDQARVKSKYAQVMERIVTRIGRGEWRVGQVIPAVPVLANQYRCDRLTILRALKELEVVGYLSVEQGRGTFVRRTRVQSYIGFLFGHDIFNPNCAPFCSLLAKTAQDFFHERGNELKFYMEHTHLLEQGVVNRDMIADAEKSVLRGLLTASSDAPPILANDKVWREQRIPWVDISSYQAADHRVNFDIGAMLHMGLDYFQRHGFRRVTAFPLDGKDVSDFIAQAGVRGLETRPEWLLPETLSMTEANGYESMQRIWESREKPDAILLTDDIMGKGAAHAMVQLGIRVPEELKVVCHANKGSGLFYPIPMPKLEFDVDQLVKEAGEMLFALMANPSLPPCSKLIRPVLRMEG